MTIISTFHSAGQENFEKNTAAADRWATAVSSSFWSRQGNRGKTFPAWFSASRCSSSTSDSTEDLWPHCPRWGLCIILCFCPQIEVWFACLISPFNFYGSFCLPSDFWQCYCMRLAVSDGHGLDHRAISVNMFPVCFPGDILHQRHVFIYLVAESSDCVLRAVNKQLHYFRARSSFKQE